MVHPGFAITFFLTFCGVRAASALEVPGADAEFCGGVFGKIVGQALPVKAYAKTAPPNEPAVIGNGLKMLPGFHKPLPLLGSTKIDKPVALVGQLSLFANTVTAIGKLVYIKIQFLTVGPKNHAVADMFPVTFIF
jgi:hypothetical protein